ncbi:Os06g0625733 [Oryza sativa Japonica Group]|uniref:Os06g0625733 protein n=1 Tax=Oryza sativa subsp. japonica TaxID=39947 RepID=A0A0N7KMF8_ORYSJ|nr:hypothetical protein EE612_035448 [Oryza sativa]BAS98697.1 Os06g0625733 [Oryza sativa Japonica Group]
MPSLSAPALYPTLLSLISYFILTPLLSHLLHSTCTISCSCTHLESSSTCTITRSDGHDSPHAAPIDSLYTCRSLYMGIWMRTMGKAALASASSGSSLSAPAATMGSHR